IVHQETQQAILIDFGIAREFTGNTQTHTSLISEGYAPIEQYMIQEKRTPATDVYGLAATLYMLLTAQVPIASILRTRQPLLAPRDIQPQIQAATNEAVMRGMAIEARHRPATVADWLALLPAEGSHFSTAPTSPPPPPANSTTAATVAVASPAPSSLPAATPSPAAAVAISVSSPRRSNLILISLITIAGAVVGVLIAIWFATRHSLAPAEPIASASPSVSVPRTESTQPDSIASLSPTPTDEFAAEPSPRSEPSVQPSAEPVSPQPQTTQSASETVPGVPVGTPEQTILAALGEPSQTSENAYWANTRSAIYEVVPDQITLGYIYDKDTSRLRQTEASFAQSVDPQVMQSTLDGMVGGSASAAIQQGLSDVQQRHSNQYSFAAGQLKGVIERDDRDRIYIGVWDADLH
ncbi:MAG TPA: hypothetical protein V6C65_35145, partial [Allocoleopsis sp.]